MVIVEGVLAEEVRVEGRRDVGAMGARGAEEEETGEGEGVDEGDVEVDVDVVDMGLEVVEGAALEGEEGVDVEEGEAVTVTTGETTTRVVDAATPAKFWSVRFPCKASDRSSACTYSRRSYTGSHPNSSRFLHGIPGMADTPLHTV